MNPLLFKKSYAGVHQIIVKLPSHRGFGFSIEQEDMDVFFASLGYAEAIKMPLKRISHRFRRVEFYNYSPQTLEFFESLGYAMAEELPYNCHRFLPRNC